MDSRYQPTKAEMEEDMSIDASPEAVARSLFPDAPLVVVSGGGDAKEGGASG